MTEHATDAPAARTGRSGPSLLSRLVPPGRSSHPLRASLPGGWLHWVSAVALLGVFGWFSFLWLQAHKGTLIEPDLQTDDVRTAIYVFHKYGPDELLADDPVAHEMEGFTPPAIRALYQVLVPTVGIYASTKWVQAICFGLIALAGWFLLRARRGGLALAVLLVFMTFHSRMLMSGTIGGMTRGFVVPVLSLWLAGALLNSERLRFGAIILAALTHPSSMAVALGAEGVMAVSRGFGRSARSLTRDRFLRYAGLVVICLCITVPYSMDQQSRVGDSFSAAEVEPLGLLTKHGRASHIPFPDMAERMIYRFLGPLAWEKDTGKPFPEAAIIYRELKHAGQALFLALLVALIMLRLAPGFRAMGAVLIATVVTYWLARLLAFKLYAPARYIQYGMPVICLLLVCGTLGYLVPRLSRSGRASVRNFVAAAFILAMMAFTGDGAITDHRMNLNYHKHGELFDFVRTLPKDVLIASHPKESDDIPWWCGRRTVVGFETMQPWWKDHWERAEKRAIDTLEAMYATDRSKLLAYCDDYGVTHLLIRKDRYIKDKKGIKNRYKKKALLFQPVDRHVKAMMKKRKHEDLLLANPPATAEVHRDKSWVLLEVAALREAWGA